MGRRRLHRRRRCVAHRGDGLHPGRHGQGAIHPGHLPAQLPVGPRPPAGPGESGAAGPGLGRWGRTRRRAVHHRPRFHHLRDPRLSQCGKVLGGTGSPKCCGAFPHCSVFARIPPSPWRPTGPGTSSRSGHSCRNRPLNASMKALPMGFSGLLKSNSARPLTSESSEIGQSACHWNLEQTVGTVRRDAARASSITRVHAVAGPPKRKAPGETAGACPEALGGGVVRARIFVSVPVQEKCQAWVWGGTGGSLFKKLRLN